MRFSERHGLKKAQDIIQIDSVLTELRTSLWNVLTVTIWNEVQWSSIDGGFLIGPQSRNQRMGQFCHALWFSYFKEPLDQLDSQWHPVLAYLRTYFFSCAWYEVYDFLEFTAQNLPYYDPNKFIAGCNSVLQREMSAYRFVGDKITAITDKAEIEEVDAALEIRLGPVRAHLNRALELLSDRHNPDYRNSIKESISAVESLVIAKLGEKGTLGQLTKKLEDEIKLHPALGKSLSSLYGYTSDGDGIRHALMELPKLTFEDAKFLLVVCSAFVNFVEARIPTTF